MSGKIKKAIEVVGILIAYFLINCLSFWFVDKNFSSVSHNNGIKNTITISASTNIPRCEQYGQKCRHALLDLINHDRLTRGLQPYTLDWYQIRGTTSCVGTIGHNEAMIQSGFIWHINNNYPEASFSNDICPFSGFSTAGENVGEWYGSEWYATQALYSTMMAEGPCTYCHYANLMSSTFTKVGIDIRRSGSNYFITEDMVN